MPHPPSQAACPAPGCGAAVFCRSAFSRRSCRAPGPYITRSPDSLAGRGVISFPCLHLVSVFRLDFNLSEAAISPGVFRGVANALLTVLQAWNLGIGLPHFLRLL